MTNIIHRKNAVGRTIEVLNRWRRLHTCVERIARGWEIAARFDKGSFHGDILEVDGNIYYF